MDQPGLVQETQAVEKLLSKHTNKRRAEAAELILLDQLIQVDTEQLKNETEMLTVDEGVLQSQ